MKNQHPTEWVAGATGLPLSSVVNSLAEVRQAARPGITLKILGRLSHFFGVLCDEPRALPYLIIIGLLLVLGTAPGWGQALCVPDGQPLTLERLDQAARLTEGLRKSREYLQTLTDKMAGDGNISINLWDGRYPGCSQGCLLFSAPAKEFGPQVGALIRQKIADAECRLRRLGVVLP